MFSTVSIHTLTYGITLIHQHSMIDRSVKVYHRDRVDEKLMQTCRTLRQHHILTVSVATMLFVSKFDCVYSYVGITFISVCIGEIYVPTLTLVPWLKHNVIAARVHSNYDNTITQIIHHQSIMAIYPASENVHISEDLQIWTSADCHCKSRIVGPSHLLLLRWKSLNICMYAQWLQLWWTTKPTALFLLLSVSILSTNLIITKLLLRNLYYMVRSKLQSRLITTLISC